MDADQSREGSLQPSDTSSDQVPSSNFTFTRPFARGTLRAPDESDSEHNYAPPTSENQKCKPTNIDTSAANELDREGRPSKAPSLSASPTSQEPVRTHKQSTLTPSFAAFSTSETQHVHSDPPADPQRTSPDPILNQHRLPRESLKHLLRLQQQQRKRRGPFSIWPALRHCPDVLLYLATFFEPSQLIGLYAIDADFHYLLDSYLPQFIGSYAQRWCICTPAELIERYDGGYFDVDGIPAASGFELLRFSDERMKRNDKNNKPRSQVDIGIDMGRNRPRYYEPNLLKIYPQHFNRFTTGRDPRRVPLRDPKYKRGAPVWRVRTMAALLIARAQANYPTIVITPPDEDQQAPAPPPTTAPPTPNVLETPDYDIAASQTTPTLRYLQLLVYRAKTIHDILATLIHDHQILVSPWTAHALAKIWLLTEIPTNGLRIPLIHSDKFFTLRDFILYLQFCVKLDMLTNDPCYPPHHPQETWPQNLPIQFMRPTASVLLRRYMLSCPSFTDILDVLQRRTLRNPQNALSAWARFSRRNLVNGLAGRSLFGVDGDLVGALDREGWGVRSQVEDRRRTQPSGRAVSPGIRLLPPAQRARLLRPDELVILELIRRRVHLTRNHFMRFMVSGYGECAVDGHEGFRKLSYAHDDAADAAVAEAATALPGTFWKKPETGLWRRPWDWRDDAEEAMVGRLLEMVEFNRNVEEAEWEAYESGGYEDEDEVEYEEGEEFEDEGEYSDASDDFYDDSEESDEGYNTDSEEGG